jgi:SNF2 family DNA or RNA helicase
MSFPLEMRLGQKIGSLWLARQHACLLADVVGYGKTIQVIQAARLAKCYHNLVICPASFTYGWRDEILTWSDCDPECIQVVDRRNTKINLDNEWTIVPYSLIIADVIKHQLTSEHHFDVLILDEAHYLANMGTQRTGHVYGRPIEQHRNGSPVDKHSIYAAADRCWRLSATIVTGYFDSMWTHLRVDAVTQASKLDFTRHFCKLKTIRVRGRRESIIRGNKNASDMRLLTANWMFRRKRAKDRPRINYTAKTLPAGPVLRKQLEALDQDSGILDMIKEYERTKNVGIFESVDARARHLLGQLIIKPAADYLIEELSSGVDKLIVWTWHREVMHGLAGRIDKARFECVQLSGGLSARRKHELVKRFQGESKIRVFLGQIAAASEAISLPVANQARFVERSFSPHQNAQAIGRMDRITQRRQMDVLDLVLPCAFSRRQAQIIRQKTKESL